MYINQMIETEKRIPPAEGINKQCIREEDIGIINDCFVWMQ